MTMVLPNIVLIGIFKNPKLIIPNSTVEKLPNNTTYALEFFRNPLPYISLNQTFIYSQIVKVFAFYDSTNKDNSNQTEISPYIKTIIENINITSINITNNNGNITIDVNDTNFTHIISNETNNQRNENTDLATIDYPMGADNMTVFIPWTYSPMIFTNLSNCKVYSFDGMGWNEENRCLIDNSTDFENAVVKCNTFGTFGVGCLIQPLNEITNQTVIVASSDEFFNSLRKATVVNTSGSNFSSFCKIIIGIITLMLI